MEFIRRITPGMTLEQLVEAQAAQQTELEEYLTRMINHAHAPIAVPTTEVEASSAAFTIVAAGFDNLNLLNTASTASTTLQEAVNFVGRGVLQKYIVVEKTSGGVLSCNITVGIKVDDTQVYYKTNSLTTQSTMRVIVGSLGIKESTSLVHVNDDSVGIPFNKSCVLQYSITSPSTGTVHVGWKIAKKRT